MKRAAFLHCVGIDLPRFKLLRQREQLPFVITTADDNSYAATFTLDHAFRLRLMLDLIGGEGAGDDQLSGLGPSYAVKLVFNAMGSFPRHPLNQFEPRNWWAGVVVFEDEGADGEPVRWSAWYAGEVEMLPLWIEEKRLNPDGGRSAVVRLFIANATRAADFVRERASELGLPEASDFSEIAV